MPPMASPILPRRRPVNGSFRRPRGISFLSTLTLLLLLLLVMLLLMIIVLYVRLSLLLLQIAARALTSVVPETDTAPDELNE